VQWDIINEQNLLKNLSSDSFYSSSGQKKAQAEKKRQPGDIENHIKTTSVAMQTTLIALELHCYADSTGAFHYGNTGGTRTYIMYLCKSKFTNRLKKGQDRTRRKNTAALSGAENYAKTIRPMQKNFITRFTPAELNASKSGKSAKIL
jgi:hypothetical protein